jgi:hypothetical protein
MMWTPNSSIGLAQAIFYLPVIPAAALLLFRRHESLKMPWRALFTFSIRTLQFFSVLKIYITDESISSIHQRDIVHRL